MSGGRAVDGRTSNKTEWDRSGEGSARIVKWYQERKTSEEEWKESNKRRREEGQQRKGEWRRLQRTGSEETQMKR